MYEGGKPGSTGKCGQNGSALQGAPGFSLPPVTLATDCSPSLDLQIAVVSPSHPPVFKYGVI